MFILLINYVISESQRKGTAVLGGGEIFRGLLHEVVATGAAICDKGLMRRQNRVARQFFLINTLQIRNLWLSLQC